MKLYKALKLKKTLAGEIITLQRQIQNKNSYLEGNNTPEKFNVHALMEKLGEKVADLIALKVAINRTNAGIQEDIFLLSEQKSYLQFLKNLSVREGVEPGYGDSVKTYHAQYDELARDAEVIKTQKAIDEIQDRIDVYNHSMSI